MVEYGLAEVGYEYLNIDDCWASHRDDTGRIVPDVNAFPDGMKDVADYVHSKGYKFGIYSDRGNLTCAGRPGSDGYEIMDAQTYAEWGVDYLKEDSCFASGDHQDAFLQYAAMRDALNQTGRPIYFSLCGWNSWYAPAGWSLGNSWRISGDVNEWPSVWNSVAINAQLASYARPGGWNDPDMLVGSSVNAAVHLTSTQSRTQFSLWSVMAAPLLIGSNMLNLTDYDLETYKNSEMIAVDQDPLGVQGQVLWQNCDVPSIETLVHESQTASFTDPPACQQIWAKRLSNADYAVLFVNWDSSKPTNVTCDAHCLATLGFTAGDFTARDLWAHSTLSGLDILSVTLDANGESRVFRLSRSSRSSHRMMCTWFMWAAASAVAVTLVLGAVALCFRGSRRSTFQSARQPMLSDLKPTRV